MSIQRARLGSLVLAVAAALFVAGPSYGFTFLFGYPYHANSEGHYDDDCCPDYGYIYHHDNTHNEPFFKEQTASEHWGRHHDPALKAWKTAAAVKSVKVKKTVTVETCCDDGQHAHGHGSHGCGHH